MDPYNIYLNKLVNKNRRQFSEYSNLHWLNCYKASEAQEIKDKLAENPSQKWMFKKTKPYHLQVSEGCKLCGEGFWSCLFITNKCNASCFYCPSPQLKDEIPATQSLSFETAESYADYINHFGFRGVSFSGGEPLLVFGRTLQYLKTIREMCSPSLYIWMYTNGMLATEEKLKLLAAAGLNEIRFDIGATNYRLDKVRLTKGIIPNITIEIPAVPEKNELIKQMLPEIIAAGVTNLNLHQLRLTIHNAPKLLQHNYTFISSEQPVVLESELAALDILDYARRKNLKIGVNYCSFYFKNRHQPAGFRRLLTKALVNQKSEITEKGYLRDYDGRSIGYKTLVISEKETINSNRVLMPHKTCFINTEIALPARPLDAKMKTEVDELLSNEPDVIPVDEFLFLVWQMEYIEKGLRDY